MVEARPGATSTRFGALVRPWLPLIPLIAGPLLFLVPTFLIQPRGGTFAQQQLEVAVWGVLWLVGLGIVYLDFRGPTVHSLVRTVAQNRIPGVRLASLSAILLGFCYFLMGLVAIIPRPTPGGSCPPACSFVNWLFGLLGPIPTLILAFFILPPLGILILAIAIDARVNGRHRKVARAAPIST